MGEEKENNSIDDKNTSMRKLDMPIGRPHIRRML